MHFTEPVYRNPYWPTWPLLEVTRGYPAENARPSNWHFRRKSSQELYRFI